MTILIWFAIFRKTLTQTINQTEKSVVSWSVILISEFLEIFSTISSSRYLQRDAFPASVWSKHPEYPSTLCCKDTTRIRSLYRTGRRWIYTSIPMALSLVYARQFHGCTQPPDSPAVNTPQRRTHHRWLCWQFHAGPVSPGCRRSNSGGGKWVFFSGDFFFLWFL